MEHFNYSSLRRRRWPSLGKFVRNTYIVLKLANEQNPESLVCLQMLFCLSQNVPSPEKTSIIYFKVLDEKCDNKETLLSIINDLYTQFILSGKKWSEDTCITRG